MESNDQLPNNDNSNDNKGYYTTLNRKLADYFITLAVFVLLILLISLSSNEIITAVSWVALFVFLLVMIFITFAYDRKFIGFAIITLLLIPIAFIGSCFLIGFH